MSQTLELVKTGQTIEISGENISMYYWEAQKEGSGIVKRSNGTVNEIGFTATDMGYYKKIGKGRIKNEDQVLKMLEAADQFLKDQGYKIR